MSPAPARTYVGVSEIDCGENPRNSDLADDKLELYNDPAAPLHTLTLKEGDIVMLTRNIDKKNGLVANVRVRIVQLREHTVEVALYSDDNEAPPKRFNVCRWRTLFRMTHDSDILIARTQFPFRLAYALAFNKAQGQTLSRVLVDLSNNRGSVAATGDKDLHGGAFAHGHLYVALSRVERSANIAVFVDDATAAQITAAHIVHTSLLYDKETGVPHGAQNSTVRREAIQNLRPGSRIGARHLRPAGYQGPIRHLYDTITRDRSRPRFLAHDPHTSIRSHAELRARLQLQPRRDRVFGDSATAANRPRPGWVERAVSIVPRRSAPLGSFANLRAALTRVNLEQLQPATLDFVESPIPNDGNYDRESNYIGTFANLHARLHKRGDPNGEQPIAGAKRSRQNVVRSRGVDMYAEHKEE